MTDEEHARSVRDAHASLNKAIELAVIDLRAAEAVLFSACETAIADGLRIHRDAFSQEPVSAGLHILPDLQIVRLVTL